LPEYLVQIPDENYKVETITKLYEATMRLVIRSVRAQDFEYFRCVATNSLGQTDGTIKIYSEYDIYAATLVCKSRNGAMSITVYKVKLSLDIIFIPVNGQMPSARAGPFVKSRERVAE